LRVCGYLEKIEEKLLQETGSSNVFQSKEPDSQYEHLELSREEMPTIAAGKNK
jgi:hypothetical protein